MLLDIFQVGQSLYTKGNLLLCKRDYLRLFGSTGYCAACRKVERYYLKSQLTSLSLDNRWSLPLRWWCEPDPMFTILSVLPVNSVDTGSALETTSTFTITRCISYNGLLKRIEWASFWQVLCGPDYEERMVFASLSSHPNQLAQLRQTSHESSSHESSSHPGQLAQLRRGSNHQSSVPASASLSSFSSSSSSSPSSLVRMPLPPIQTMWLIQRNTHHRPQLKILIFTNNAQMLCAWRKCASKNLNNLIQDTSITSRRWAISGTHHIWAVL